MWSVHAQAAVIPSMSFLAVSLNIVISGDAWLVHLECFRSSQVPTWLNRERCEELAT